MINEFKLINILLEQKEELLERMKGKIIDRNVEKFISLDSSLAQIVTGIRRSGKSTLCESVLVKSKKPFAYVNFDDERLGKLSSEDLNVILETLYKINDEFSILFFDEIQNVPSWELFVNRLLRSGFHILITGSNSKMLSSDLATHLTGRSNIVELSTFSFFEYCTLCNIETKDLTTKRIAELKKTFYRYFGTGGFPEILKRFDDSFDFNNFFISTEDSFAFNYVNSLTLDILINDIEKHFGIKYKKEFENLSQHILNVVPFELNIDEIKKEFGFKSNHTIQNYIMYLEEAYLIISISRFSFKSRERLTKIKLYPCDISFMNNRVNPNKSLNLAFRLETLVLLELRRRFSRYGLDISYYKDRTYECDFVVSKGFLNYYAIQVSYDISLPKTRSREIKGLVSTSKKIKAEKSLLIIYEGREEKIMVEGVEIHIVPFAIWAVSK